MKEGFRQMLAERQKGVNSLVCVGLDPLASKLPESVRKEFGDSTAKAVAHWMKKVVDATAPYTSMYKPQSAYWESIPQGREALQEVVNHIKAKHPGIPVFLDCKRGDIGRTQERYRIAHIELDGADGVNFSPYMGKDCMEYLVDKASPGKAIVGLCYTSNPSSRKVQDVKLQDGRPYWEFIAETTLSWARELGIEKDAGLVMAAAFENPDGSGNVFSTHLSRCREIVGNDMWFLIPGIGTQGGFVEETVKSAYTGPGSIAINSSSGIIFAGQGDDFAEAAANKARELRDQIRAAGGNVV
jgi:orotidine-5'-phosphate decarboxylase